MFHITPDFRKFISLLLIAIALVSVSSAKASVLTYDFVISIVDGPNIGSELTGFVSFDDANVPLDTFVESTDLLVELEFEYFGIVYDTSTAISAILRLNSDGSLHTLVFGNNCGPGWCAVGGPNQWNVALIENPFSDFQFSGGLPDATFIELGVVTYTLRPVPIPPAILLMLSGFAALFTHRLPMGRKASP